MARHVWVIQMLCDGKWEPTIGTGITRDDAQMRKRAEWEKPSPDDKFRIRKYIPEPQNMKEIDQLWDTYFDRFSKRKRK
jgi:hypothetical protein